MPRAVSILLSVVFLAWVAGAIVGPSIDGDGSQEETFTIEVLPIEGSRLDEGGCQVSVPYLYADGQPYRLSKIIREGVWGRHTEGLSHGCSETHDTSLSHRVSLRARRIVLGLGFSKWGGVVRVMRAGEPLATIDLQTESEQEEISYYEFPYRESPWWFRPLVFLVGLALAAGFHARWGAGMDHAWVLVHFASLYSLIWLGTLVGYGEDSPGYLLCMTDFLGGDPSYFPPGYGFLVAASSMLPFEGEGIRVTLLQAGLAVMAAAWLLRILRRFCAPGTALIAVLAAGSSSTVLWMTRSALSESLTVFCIIGGIHWGLRARESGLRRHAVFAGLLAGWGGLTRILPLLVLLPVFAMQGWPFTRRSVGRSGISIGVALLCVLLPMSWAKINSGHFALSDSSGGHLFNAVVYQQNLLDPEGPYTAGYLELLDGEDPFGREHFDVRTLIEKGVFEYLTSGQEEELGQAGKEAVEQRAHEIAKQSLTRIAMEAIWRQPGTYVSNAMAQAWGQLVTPPTMPSYGDVPEPVEDYGLLPLLGCSADMVRWRVFFSGMEAFLWPFICWLFLLSGVLCLVLRERRGLLVLFWVVLAYLLPQAFIEQLHPRYTAPVSPFVIVLAVVILDEALRRMLGRFRGGSG